MRLWLASKLHPSWLIGWLCLGFLLGVAASIKLRGFYFTDIFWILLAAWLTGLVFVKRSVWLVMVIIFAGLILGLWKGSQLRVQLLDYRPYYGRQLSVKGMVAEDTSYGAKGDQRLNLTNITIDNKRVKGRVWVSASKSDIKRGDTLTATGKLGEGFGNTSATMYRANISNVARPEPGDVARRVRDWFAGSVRQGIPEPQVSLGLGYLLGQRAALPKDLENQIKITGLTHVVVASGYNLTILVSFCRKLFIRASKFLATFMSSLLIMSFMLITGLSPSMSRAGLVAGLSLLTWYYGRKVHPFVLLSFAAAVTVMYNPSYIWGDLGWYLSFGSFVGVIIFAPLVHSYFWNSEAGLMRGLFVETMSAQIVTTPIILLSFGQFSVYALLANILVLPFVPLAMLCTFIAGVVGLILPQLAITAGLPATLILRYSTQVIAKVSDLPSATIELKFNPWIMIVSYVGIATLIIYMKWRTHYDFRCSSQGNKQNGIGDFS